jgi:gliding motility-associated-like protein
MDLNSGNNLESLFKSKFEGFEPEVDANVWNNIQSKMAKTNAPSDSGMSNLMKLAIGTAAVGALVIGAIYFMSPKENTIKAETNTANNTKTITESGSNGESSNTLNTDNQTTIEINTGNKTTTSSTNLNPKNNQNKTNNSTNNSNQADNQNEHDNADGKENLNHQLNNTTTEKHTNNNTNDNVSNHVNNTVETEVDQNQQEVNFTVADIDKTPVGGYAPLTVYFNNKGKAQSCEWNFGDEMPYARENNTVHIYEKPGKYTVLLTANYGSKVETDTVIVEVLTPSYIPTAFSPNGDGINDVFKVTPTDLTFIESVIYDRQGKMVAQWNSVDDGWDGVNMKTGEKCAFGAYIFTVKWKTPEGKHYEQKGTVTLTNN